MQTARQPRRQPPPLPPPATSERPPVAEYILIGPPQSLEDLAQVFAELEASGERCATGDTSRTLEVPTVRIRIWNQPDGKRLVEVNDHRGEKASVLFSRVHPFAR
jgi:hypothetical protein